MATKRSLLDDELEQANPFYRSPEAQRRDAIGQADQAAARRLNALDGATVPQIRMATPPPATSLAEFGDPNSRFRQVYEPGLTREERQRRRDRFSALDQADLGRANDLKLANIDARGKVDAAREAAQGQIGAASMQSAGSIVQSLLGGGTRRASATGGETSPLDSLRLARELGYQNPTEIAKEQRDTRETARKASLDLLQKDFGPVYPGAGYDPNQGPYTIDDYIKDITHARKTPVPRMEAILNDLNKQYQAAYGRPYFDRPTPGEGQGYGAPATQGMGDLKQAERSIVAPPAQPPAARQPGAYDPRLGLPAAQSQPSAAPTSPSVHAQALTWANQTLDQISQNPNRPDAAALRAKAEAIRRKAQQAGQI